MPLRLKRIYDTLSDVIARHQPDEFAIETAFYGKNAQSALKLGHARGVAMLAAVSREIPTQEYSPREVKKAIVGSGTASKEQVQYMVKVLLRLKDVPVQADVADALAVAMCHIQRRSGAGRRASGSWKSYLAAHPEKVLSSPRAARR
jgi:crossover junction endodeoxyribonuclease RuvC